MFFLNMHSNQSQKKYHHKNQVRCLPQQVQVMIALALCFVSPLAYVPKWFIFFSYQHYLF